MSEQNMKRQRGLSLLGLIFACAIIIVVALVGIKVAPDVIEYFAIVKNVKAVAADPGTRGASVNNIRINFDRRSSIDNIKSVTGPDLDISKEGNDVVIAFAYSKKIPLYGPVSLVIDFEGSSAQ